MDISLFFILQSIYDKKLKVCNQQKIDSAFFSFNPQNMLKIKRHQMPKIQSQASIPKKRGCTENDTSSFLFTINDFSYFA